MTGYSTGEQNVLNVCSAVQKFNVAFRPQKTIRTIRDGGAQDGHPDFHTQLLSSVLP